jgi:hypothetical protein
VGDRGRFPAFFCLGENAMKQNRVGRPQLGAVVALVLGLGLLAALLAVPRAGLAERQEPSGAETFPVAASPGESEAEPAVAYDAGRRRFMVVYENTGSIDAACLRENGEVVRRFSLGGGTAPDVAYNNAHDQYLVVYQSTGDQIDGVYIDGACCPGCSGAPFAISGSRPYSETLPAVAYNGDPGHQDYLVVWQDQFQQNPSGWGIWARRVTSMSVSGANIPIAVDPVNQIAYLQPVVAHNLGTNAYLVVYTRDASSPSGKDICGRLVSALGVTGTEGVFDATEKNQQDPAVAAYPLNLSTPYLVVYSDFYDDELGDIRGILVKDDGVASSYLEISTASNVHEQNPDLASGADFGGYSVVWSQGTSDSDVYSRRVTGSGKAGPLVQVTDSELPDGKPAVSGDAPAPLAVWQTGNGADWDVYGELLPYMHHYLPLLSREFYAPEFQDGAMWSESAND